MPPCVPAFHQLVQLALPWAPPLVLLLLLLLPVLPPWELSPALLLVLPQQLALPLVLLAWAALSCQLLLGLLVQPAWLLMQLAWLLMQLAWLLVLLEMRAAWAEGAQLEWQRCQPSLVGLPAEVAWSAMQHWQQELLLVLQQQRQQLLQAEMLLALQEQG